MLDLPQGDVARIRDALFAPAKIIGKAPIMRNQPIESMTAIKGKTRVTTTFAHGTHTKAADRELE